MRLSRVGAFRGEDIATRARCHLELGTVMALHHQRYRSCAGRADDWADRRMTQMKDDT